MNHNFPSSMKINSFKFFLKAVLIFGIVFGCMNLGFSRPKNSENKAGENNALVDTAFQLLENVREAGRFIHKLDSSYTLDFPVGIIANDSKEAEKYAIIVSELKIKNGEPYVTAYMAFVVPGTTKKIAFRGVDIPFSFSGGIKGEAVLELVSDFNVKLTKSIKLRIKGSGQTKVKWGCSGFINMEIVSDVLFDSKVFIPENPDGSLKNDTLKTTIHKTITNWNNFMVGITLHPFQIKGLEGVGFSVSSAVLDLSDFDNPTNINFPSNYQADYFIEGNSNIWQGVYIQDVQVRLPEKFRKKTNSELKADTLKLAKDPTKTHVIVDTVSIGRLTFYAQNLIIDELGFTGKFGASRLMTIDEGNLGGWAFSLENFSIDFQANKLIKGEFSGQIQVPQFKESSRLSYRAQIGLNDTYKFNVNVNDSIEMEMWAGQLLIKPNSALNIKIKKKQFLPSLLLNGKLTLNSPVDKSDSTSTKLAIAEIPFDGMRIQTVEPYFSVDNISFGTSQNLFSKFPVSINEIGFENVNNRVGLRFGLTVNFVGENDGGFGGDGVFTVWGKRENRRWKYDGVKINDIKVDYSKPNAYSLKGGVAFIRGDEIYGNGFRGEIEAKFGGFELEVVALFGKVDGYRYWFADGLFSSDPSLCAIGPVSIYGFGGGASYHMKQAGVGTLKASGIGKSISGVLYSPSKETGLGIRASVVFGLTGSASAFNGEVEFGVIFNADGGVSQLSFSGNGYFASGKFEVTEGGIMETAKHIMNEEESGEIPVDEEKGQIWGSISVLYDFDLKTFHADFSVYINVFGGLIKGTGTDGLAGWGVIHFGPKEWYIHLGAPPDKKNGIEAFGGLVTLENYFMAGSSVPEMAPPPEKILAELREKNVNQTEIDKLKVKDLNDKNGAGFIFGASFKIGTGEERTFLIFYGRLGLDVGFDLSLKKYSDAVCKGTGTLGINGWYAQGQSYAWFDASVGIKVSLPFYSGKYIIFEMTSAALLQAKGPNPFWMKGEFSNNYNILNGLIKGNCRFEFEIGERCEFIETNPLGDMSIISELTPTKDEKEVSVFTTPQVVFNMPINEIIEFQDENKTTKTYRIKLNHFKVGVSDGTPINGKLIWNDRKDVLVFKSKDILPGEKKLIVSAKVTFQELKNGNWFTVTKGGTEVVETKEAIFITGKEPDHISQSNVLSSYPGYRAFNYYKSEDKDKYIKLEFGQSKLFQPGNEWEQKARAIPLSGGSPVTIKYSYDDPNTKIKLQIPTKEINNNTIYRLEIVNTPKNSNHSLDKNVVKNVENIQIESSGDSTDVTVTTQKAEESREQLQDKVIYSMEFRSSNYNTLAEKLQELDYSNGISYQLATNIHSLTVRIEGERFDSHEVVNLEKETLISTVPDLSKTEWYNNNYKLLFNLSDSELKSIDMKPFKLDPLTTYFFQEEGTRNLTSDEIENGFTKDIVVVSGMKNYIAKYLQLYYFTIRSQIVNSNLEGNNKFNDIFSSKFVPLKTGNYPVNVYYTLPSEKTKQKVAEKNIYHEVDTPIILAPKSKSKQ